MCRPAVCERARHRPQPLHHGAGAADRRRLRRAQEAKARCSPMKASSVRAGVLVALLALGAFVAASQAEIAQQGALRVKFNGKLAPKELPRKGARGVAVAIGGKITTTDGSEPPQLRRIEIA